MDTAIVTGIKFPGYTTAELKGFVAAAKDGSRPLPADRLAKMVEEIAAREAGTPRTLHDRLAAAAAAKPKR